MKNSSRRQFLKTSASFAAGSAIMRSNPIKGSTLNTSVVPAYKLTQFNYEDVQLLDGPMLEQFKNNVDLFMSLPEDNLLKPFRQLAGLPAPGEDMGGWYSPSSEFNPPKDMHGYVPGHSFGQYVSGLSRAYGVTGNKDIQAKVHRLVNGFAPTAVSRFYAGYCLPAYTFDKTNCGLIDAHQFAKDPSALAVLHKATDAVLPWLPEKALNRQEMMARPHKNIAYTWDESYTLPENFYLAYQRGAGTRYRTLAQRFLEDDTYFGPLSEGKNVLPGQHAYSHVNALCSAMQCYLTDNSTTHLNAARNGFHFVLDQSFATGGWGPDETFRKPGTDELVNTLHTSHSSFETPCGAYGHFKISRYLMGVSGDSSYGDSMEAVLYNTILGARPIRSDGISFYYSDYNNDATKADFPLKWPCCSGTFPQLTADYGISSYFRSPKGVYVNLYVPSRVVWKQGNSLVRMTQRTSYPNTGDTLLQLAMDRAERFTIALRVPAWAGAGTSVRINGKPAEVTADAGRWLEINREWKNGDHLEFTVDMPLRLVPIDPQHPDVVALLHGPVALFAVNQGAMLMTKRQMLAAQRVGSSPDWEVATAGGKVRLKSFPEITTETYRLYQNT